MAETLILSLTPSDGWLGLGLKCLFLELIENAFQLLALKLDPLR